MKRLLLNVLTALSLLLCVAVVALWGWTYDGGAYAEWRGRRFAIGAEAERGKLTGWVQRTTAARQGPQGNEFRFRHLPAGWLMIRFDDRPVRSSSEHSFGPVQYVVVTHATATKWTLRLPAWLLGTATAVLPVMQAFVAASRLRRGHPHLSGRCTRCGYDLRATPGRCPECGEAPRAD
jgi:hypothetical protein